MSYSRRTTTMPGITSRGKAKTTIKEKKSKPKSDNPQRKSKSAGGSRMELRLTKAQMARLKEHSKLHSGGMSSPHIKKMIFVMEKEGKSFDVAHKIAVNHLKKMKSKKK